MADKDKDEQKNQHAAALSRLGASKGGRARADKLTPEARQDIARKAASARWAASGTDLPYATHAGILHIGDATIPCAVLKDGRRVLTQEGFLEAIGRAAKAKGGQGAAGVDNPPAFLAAKNIIRFVSEDLRRSTTPIVFRPLKAGYQGGRAFGYPAELLPAVCNVFLQARDAGALLPSQHHIAKACDLLVRGLAMVGIIALVDEATGYQYDRAAKELQEILKLYVRPEMQRVLPIFPTEFFQLIYKMHGWEFKAGHHRRPGYVGVLINDWIYKRLPEPVLPELQKRNPSVNGRRKDKHYWYLTDEQGLPHANRQIAVVMALLRASRCDKQRFNDMLIDACPIQGDQQYLPFPDPPEDDDAEE